MARKPDVTWEQRKDKEGHWNRGASKLKAHLKHRYGITVEDWDAMYDKQDGKCGLCLQPDKKLVVDHDHDTMKVRGLLCHRCNTALSLEENFSGWLNRAAAWLRG